METYRPGSRGDLLPLAVLPLAIPEWHRADALRPRRRSGRPPWRRRSAISWRRSILECPSLNWPRWTRRFARTRFQSHRVLARAAAVLGIVALLLASVGLYGVTSYSVAMRAREIAVRMALGARADRVVAMVLRQALAVATIGSVLGGLVAHRGRARHSGGGVRCRRSRYRGAGRIGGVACGGHAPGQHPAGLAGRPAGPECGAARRVGSMADGHSALTERGRPARESVKASASKPTAQTRPRRHADAVPAVAGRRYVTRSRAASAVRP